MIKRILLSFAMLLIIGYLAFALMSLNHMPPHQVCNKVQLIVKDSMNLGSIPQTEVFNLLKEKKIYPVGKKMSVIKSKVLERQLKTHPLIENAECYKTPEGSICIEITQRVPFLRVISNNGENYYLDNKGSIIPPGAKCNAHVAIVTGEVEKPFAMKELYKMGVFLQNNPFWEAQIEQINILPGNEIELVPRIGDHIIFLGKLENFKDKLGRLEKFYEKALNKVGWNKYSRINLEFDNQIICTKKEK